LLVGWLPHSSCAQNSNDIVFKRLKSQEGVVAAVLSTDTIVLTDDKKVKLIGLMAPAVPRNRKVEKDEDGFIVESKDPTSTFEERAIDFARKLLEGKRVRLELDNQVQDGDFHTLAYVFIIDDETLANAEILRQGYANLQLRPPNMKYADRLRQAYREAREEKRGLHGE